MGTCSSRPAKPEDRPDKCGNELAPEQLPVYDVNQGPFFVSDKKAKRPIVFAQTGVSSKEYKPVKTFSALFQEAAAKKGDMLALAAEWPTPLLNADGTAPPALPLDQWRKWTWKEYFDECFDIAKAVVSLGVQEFDGACIYGANSPFWMMTFMSCLLSTVIPAGIYPTDTKDQIAYKAKYADASIAFCDDLSKLVVFESMLDDVPMLKTVVLWAATPEKREMQRSDGSVVSVMTWNELRELGKQQENNLLDERISAQSPEQCCAFCFTSGTTGNPKAVMLSHDNLAFQAVVTVASLKNYGKEEERTLSYLPLSHVAGVCTDIIVPVAISSLETGSCGVYFARVYDLKAGSLGDRLRSVKPTFFLGVPRVWEKIAEKMKAAGAQTKGLKKKIATFAKAKGSEYLNNSMMGGSGEKPAFYDFANEKVLTKVKTALGLEHCKYAITGAAPMNPELQMYFGSLGIPIMDMYGMSECCGSTTANLLQCFQFGTVGTSTQGCEVRVFKVDDSDVNKKVEVPKAKDVFNPTEEEQGELCYRGRHIMLGYYANPNLGPDHVAEINKKNAETIDNEGYLHSGDKGAVSEKFMYRVTGRYKELIIGAGGENIAPVPVEDNVKSLAEGISNFIMIGDNRKFNVAVVTLRAVGATGENPGSDDLDPAVHSIGSPGVTKISQAISDPKWIKHIQDAIESTNSNGAVCQSNAWKIQKFTILPHDLSINGGELTPTLKTKRAFVDTKYKDAIDAMYDSTETYVMFSGEQASPPAAVSTMDVDAKLDQAAEQAESSSTAAVQEATVASN